MQTKISENIKTNNNFVSTRNSCKLCAPLGASLVFKGIEGCVPLIHGSQGCATYIRRYLISHFKEPVDIASSNFSEESTIYGGSRNFITGINNIIKQYKPTVIGIASTCLSETIGEDVPAHIYNYLEANKNNDKSLPSFIYTSTPSYAGSHSEGFHNTVLATIKSLAEYESRGRHITILPSMISPADIRYLKEILSDFEIKYTLFPDYSETLDNEFTAEYQLIPTGGTSIYEIKRIGNSKAVIEFGEKFNKSFSRIKNKESVQTAGEWLASNYYIKNYQMPMPIGIEATDRFFDALKEISGKETPENHRKERGRLIDSYVDSHKYIFGKKALLYGEPDLVSALANWCQEIGIEPFYIPDTDFETLRTEANKIKPDLLIGNSKGYYIARERKIPLVRVGFPIHDRVGGNRMLHLGYKGTQELFDRVVNALLEYKQENSPVGFKYM
ncbi:Nitrogenase [uncultured Paludibacter sp.]|uniref:Nitrogenase n=1 Tax=uncultured Paludibacter sp. TaxID=497635 RepID=A0A653A9N3_9BACT|nr:Nitrogenase [uncultured Paludibacter sp.]